MIFYNKKGPCTVAQEPQLGKKLIWPPREIYVKPLRYYM